MVGESVLGIQVRDVRTVIGYLRSEKYTEISIKGWAEDDRGAEPEGTGWDDLERDGEWLGGMWSRHGWFWLGLLGNSKTLF